MSTLNWSSARIAIAAANWNSSITDVMAEGARTALRGKGIPDASIHLVRCPGAYELPLAVKYLLEQRREDGSPAYDAIVAIAVVIRGGTPHFEVVCDAVNRGITDLILQFGRPVGFGVLTTDNVSQAMERAGLDKGNKGAEAALAACDMLELAFDLGVRMA
jgi:6,7-dimethyl-8-ribityllumazine synthase